jgi:hypothetical protein
MRGENNLGDFIIASKRLRADMERTKSKATEKAAEKEKHKKGLKGKSETTREK